MLLQASDRPNFSKSVKVKETFALCTPKRHIGKAELKS